MDGNSDLPLERLRVLDLSQDVAGAYCTRLLAGLGADVIKVEPPATGDPIRSRGLFYKNTPDLETSALHLHLNLSKKSITLNLEDSSGRQILDKLLGDTSIIVETLGRERRGLLGLQYQRLLEIKPDLIMTSISGFGDSGPYADYRATEGIAMALGGMTYLSGDPAEPPLQPGGNTAYCVAGEYACVATASAVLLQKLTGEGQHIEVSIADAVASIIEINPQRMINDGNPPQRAGNWQGPARGIYPCRDGYFGVVMRPREGLKRIAGWLGVGELLAERFDPFYRNEDLSDDLQSELNGLLVSGFLEHDKQEIYHGIQQLHIPFGFVADFKDALESHQLNARGFFVEIDHPVVGKQKYPSAPYQATRMTWRLERAPLLGEHNREIICRRLGYSKEDFAALQKRAVI